MFSPANIAIWKSNTTSYARSEVWKKKIEEQFPHEAVCRLPAVCRYYWPSRVGRQTANHLLAACEPTILSHPIGTPSSEDKISDKEAE